MLLRTDDILRTVEGLPEFREAATVLVYWAIGDEVPTQAFIEKWYGYKRMVLPVVVSDTEMELREYDPAVMGRGRFGIPEPAHGTLVDPADVDFALVPGRMFDMSGNRKGHGKGYYDRLLPRLGCMTVGIAHNNRVVEHLPTMPWDVPVNLVITEK